MKREKHASYSSHNSCKSLSEELRDYYEGRHKSHLRPHSHKRFWENGTSTRCQQELYRNLPFKLELAQPSYWLFSICA